MLDDKEVTSTIKIWGAYRDFAKYSGTLRRVDWYLPQTYISQGIPASQYERNVIQQACREVTCLELEVAMVYDLFDRRIYVYVWAF
jgi:hypothetical protein